jgi:hypothetical protein
MGCTILKLNSSFEGVNMEDEERNKITNSVNLCGEFIESLNKYDLREFTREEFEQLIFVAVKGYCEG